MDRVWRGAETRFEYEVLICIFFLTPAFFGEGGSKEGHIGLRPRKKEQIGSLCLKRNNGFQAWLCSNQLCGSRITPHQRFLGQ